MINRGGENVYSIEVESALAGAPGVERGRRDRRARRHDGREGRRGRDRAAGDGSTSRRSSPTRASASPTSRCRSTSPCATSRSRATPAARCSRRSCATRPSGASRSTDRRGIRWRRCRPCRAPWTRASWGPSLIHEHVRFRDEAVAENWPGRYDADAELAAALEAVNAAKDHGVRTIVDPTAMFGGRDVRFMAEVAEQTGVQIVACTGIYTYDYLPHYFENRSEDQIAELFVDDIEQGIQGTEIKAAFLKCAADAPGVTEHIEKVHRAVARASVQTGAPIMAHSRPASNTGPRQVEIFREEGVDPGEDPDRPHRRQRRPRLHRGPPRHRRLDRPRPLRPRPLPAVRAAQRDHRRAAAPRPRRPPLPLPGLLRDDRLVPARRRRRC